MKNRMSVISAAMAIVFAGSAFATANAAEALDAQSVTTVESRAPLSATLMPTVSIDADASTSEANPATMRIADTAPLQVTLLPTVYVTAKAHSQEMVATMLPTVRVTAQIGSWESPVESARIADAEDAIVDLPDVDDASTSNAERGLALRARSMPR
jgi:hypothetical protein